MVVVEGLKKQIKTAPRGRARNIENVFYYSCDFRNIDCQHTLTGADDDFLGEDPKGLKKGISA